MSDPWLDDPDLARNVVREGLDLIGTSGVVAGRIGKLSLLSREEFQAMEAFGAQIDSYCNLDNPKHPLCLGVFGPPGSGKSFAVTQLIKTKGLTARTLNLSQFQGPSDLSGALAELARWTSGETPVVFFDEFDSRLAGAPLGWLQWLLAPMQDGIAFDHGHRVELKRAIFLFAGGTVDTFEEFPSIHEGYYRVAKGPDFLSRLRGHVNIRGVNDGPYRRVRRALVLRLAIERVASGLLNGQGQILEEQMTDEFIDQLLAVGRYQHGARSVEALVEMSTNPKQQQFSALNLPSTDVLASHVDLGPLGELVIALSAGGEPHDVSTEVGGTALAQVWPKVATRLLEMGAGLIYGGDLHEGNGVFTQQLIQANSRLPNLLNPAVPPGDDFRNHPSPGRIMWVRAGTGSQTQESNLPDRVTYRQLENLLPEELDEIGLSPDTDLYAFDRAAPPAPNWRDSQDWCRRLGYSLAIFRMRALVMRLADAHLVFGGREHGSLGRFPGIAEEVMLSMASGIPVYVCGGFGGAAWAVGQALGLGEPWAIKLTSLEREAHDPGALVLETASKEWGARFQLPDRSDLPLSYEELREFLRSHALGSPGWPDNGLTEEENRVLFQSREEHEIVALVEKGLRRRFLLK